MTDRQCNAEQTLKQCWMRWCSDAKNSRELYILLLLQIVVASIDNNHALYTCAALRIPFDKGLKVLYKVTRIVGTYAKQTEKKEEEVKLSDV